MPRVQGDSGISGLHVQQLAGAGALPALLPGLAGSGCRLQRLTLCGLEARALGALAAALTGSTGSHLATLTLQDCRWVGSISRCDGCRNIATFAASGV